MVYRSRFLVAFGLSILAAQFNSLAGMQSTRLHNICFELASKQCCDSAALLAECIKLLNEGRGAGLNTPTSYSGETPMHFLLKFYWSGSRRTGSYDSFNYSREHLEQAGTSLLKFLQLMHGFGAKFNLPDAKGVTPLAAFELATKRETKECFSPVYEGVHEFLTSTFKID